ncbi:DUF2887 domain-containing protein [Oscillatoria sp. CS-180]|uniref:DUF2887 domain-containing protein n=1 Tax=Oscillatoria sp. CS-180 TaxID=3021720 RepID=UPI00232EE603|nr:DUF2887 domain-containing protein [Oscillatoria sp. CS-180]MDB9525401.1 DUF2887 domain-containing protein [Oscillatoria sp. CS-180]
MKTDKLYYYLFLSQPSLLADLLPGLPQNCEYEYSAPVIKEGELRLDGLLTPISDDMKIPIIFVEAQMQTDFRFYGRYFAEIHLYLHQYQVERPWQGLIILQSRQQKLGSAVPYKNLLDRSVQRIYLQDLLEQTRLSPALALLQLIVLPNNKVPQAARALLADAKKQGDAEFWRSLNLVEAILINKFPQLSTEEVLAMLDIKTTDIKRTRFYQEVFREGEQQGEQRGEQRGQQRGEATALIRFLGQLLGTLEEAQKEQIHQLSLSQLEALGIAMPEIKTHSDLQAWLDGMENISSEES